MTIRMNIATASVLLSLAITAAVGAPIASAAQGAKATVKHHSRPKTHVKVGGAIRADVSGGCVSVLVEEYFTIFSCDGGLPFSGTPSPVPAPTVEPVQSLSLLQPATVVVPAGGCGAGSSATGSDASDSC